MLGLHPAVLLLCCIAGHFDVDGLLTVETRVGQAPLDADGVVRWGVVGTATPDLVGSYLSRRLDLRLDYAPRIFWREPNDFGTLRPLVLHAGNFAGIAQVTRRLRLTGLANASAGETDYTALTQILGPAQAALPSVVEFLSINSNLTAQYDLSRLSSFSTTLAYIYRRPIGAAADVVPMANEVPPFPRQTTVAVTPALREKLTRTDELTLSTIFSYGTYSAGIDSAGHPTGRTQIYTVVPEAIWQLRLSPRYDLRAGAGIAYAHVNPSLDVQSPVAPVGELGLDMRLTKNGAEATRASVTARLDYFVDPVLAVAGPRAMLTAGLFSTLNPDWMLGVEASYATVFVGTSVQPGYPVVDETVVYANIPVRYRASDHIQMEFGFRYADRGPSVEIDAFGFHQRQLWLYYLLTASTRRPTSRMVQ